MRVLPVNLRKARAEPARGLSGASLRTFSGWFHSDEERVPFDVIT